MPVVDSRDAKPASSSDAGSSVPARAAWAAARAVAEAAREGRLDPSSLDEAGFGQRLFTAGMPDPDLIIRTSGEQRLSNFLLWQSAYAELVFLDVLWPDFGPADFGEALAEFNRRERRFGARPG